MLSKEIRELYKSRHPHIAPDLRDGVCSQWKSSDVFSFGHLISILIERVPLNIPALQALAQKSMKYNSADRPATNDLNTSLNNLIL